MKDHGADFKATDKDGNSAIHLLAENKRIEDPQSLKLAIDTLSSCTLPPILNVKVSSNFLVFGESIPNSSKDCNPRKVESSTYTSLKLILE